MISEVTKARMGRLTVVGEVYHQQCDQQPIAVSTKYSRGLESDEQPYVRKITVGEEALQLDTGWIKSASLVIIENLEGRYLLTNPSDEQRQAVSEAVVQIYFGNDCGGIEVLPCESCRITPMQLNVVSIQCRKGSAKVIITLFPR